MKWSCVLLVAVWGSACTKTNEEKFCTEGGCTTPDFPFCDLTGFASGEPGTCIAVTCTSNEFAECRGDAEVRCNAGGTNYDIVQCERGCDSDADGCRLCEPGQTACTNGALAVCNDTGAIISKDVCELGCFEDQPRCRDIAPSNGLGQYLDMFPNPPDLDLSAGATIETITGTVTTVTGSMTVPSFLVAPALNGAQIRVVVAGRVRLGDVIIVPRETFANAGPALAILASGDISVEGRIEISNYEGATAGGVAFSDCRGGDGKVDNDPDRTIFSSSGGGGHATAGGAGGSIGTIQTLTGGAGGAASGNETLIPLRGGCAGSNGGVPGGGALQLSSRTQITVNGTINVNGGSGPPAQGVAYGGGAGGGILLEAPIVMLGPQAKLLANGGAGASSQRGGMISESLSPALGGPCTSAGAYCGAGGNGAAANSAAANGGSAMYTAEGSVMYITGGGGGGGLGRVRVNTRDGTYTKANSAIEAAVATSGVLTTR